MIGGPFRFLIGGPPCQGFWVPRPAPLASVGSNLPVRATDSAPD
jgi:hypothetical protein